MQEEGRRNVSLAAELREVQSELAVLKVHHHEVRVGERGGERAGPPTRDVHGVPPARSPGRSRRGVRGCGHTSNGPAQLADLSRQLDEHKDALARAELARVAALEQLAAERLQWSAAHAGLNEQVALVGQLQADRQELLGQLEAEHARAAKLEERLRTLRETVEAEQSEKLEEMERTWQQEQAAVRADVARTTADLAAERRRNADVQQIVDRLRFIVQEKEAAVQAATRERERVDAELQTVRLAQQAGAAAQQTTTGQLHEQLAQAHARLEQTTAAAASSEAQLKRYDERVFCHGRPPPWPCAVARFLKAHHSPCRHGDRLGRAWRARIRQRRRDSGAGSGGASSSSGPRGWARASAPSGARRPSRSRS